MQKLVNFERKYLENGKRYGKSDLIFRIFEHLAIKKVPGIRPVLGTPSCRKIDFKIRNIIPFFTHLARYILEENGPN